MSILATGISFLLLHRRALGNQRAAPRPGAARTGNHYLSCRGFVKKDACARSLQFPAEVRVVAEDESTTKIAAAASEIAV